MKKLYAALIAVVFMTGNVFAAGSDVVQTLAVVNGEPVFAEEFNEIAIPMLEQYRMSVPQEQQSEEKVNELKNAVLNQKIEDVLIKQEAKKKKIKVSKKELQDSVDQIKKRFANESEFQAELKKEKISMAEFEKKLSEQVSVMKLVRQTVDSKVKVPTEPQIKEFFDKVQLKMKGGETGLSKEDDELATNLAVFLNRMSGEQIRLRQVFVSCPKNATTEETKAALSRVDIVKKALKNGKTSFAEIAGNYSEDAVSKSKNGDIGIVVKGDLPPEMDKIVFDMNVGEYTKEPIKTDNGYHFLRVEEKRASKAFSFDEVKNEIGELMYRNEAQKAYLGWINELKSKADIKINKTW